MRAARAGNVVTAARVAEPYVPKPPKLASLDELGIDGLLTWLGVSGDEPLEILACDRESRCRVAGVHSHILSTSLPSECALEVKQLLPSAANKGAASPLHWDQETRVFIDAPSLALMHAAQRLERLVKAGKMVDLEAQLRLIALACEFCRSYARDPHNPLSANCHYDERGTCKRFVSPSELQAILLEFGRARGLTRARKAAQHALDHSGSPMETYLDLGLFLPPRLGGLSLRMPLLNQQIEVSDEVRKRLRHKSLRPDMHWPDQHVLGEYFGDKEHANKSARVEDKNRLQDYATTGYAPVLLMYDDVRNATRLNQTAKRFARMLMERGVKNELYRINRILGSKEFKLNQRVLAKALLPPLMRYPEAWPRPAPGICWLCLAYHGIC